MLVVCLYSLFFHQLYNSEYKRIEQIFDYVLSGMFYTQNNLHNNFLIMYLFPLRLIFVPSISPLQVTSIVLSILFPFKALVARLCASLLSFLFNSSNCKVSLYSLHFFSIRLINLSCCSS